MFMFFNILKYLLLPLLSCLKFSNILDIRELKAKYIYKYIFCLSCIKQKKQRIKYFSLCPLCRLTQPKRVPAAPIWGSRAKVVSGLPDPHLFVSTHLVRDQRFAGGQRQKEGLHKATIGTFNNFTLLLTLLLKASKNKRPKSKLKLFKEKPKPQNNLSHRSLA
jgi:hypothetical protein